MLHNFRIIGTIIFSAISTEHNSRIIGSDSHINFEGVVRAVGVWLGCGLSCTTWSDKMSQTDRSDWWEKADKLPEWSNACRKALLLQPSSTASRRGFFCFARLS